MRKWVLVVSAVCSGVFAADKKDGGPKLVSPYYDSRILGQLADYLSTAGGVNIIVPDEFRKLEVKLDTKSLQPETSWRAVLEIVCRQHSLRIDDSKLKDTLIYIWKPKTVSCTFKNADLREVIFAIATDAEISIVIDPEVKGEVTAILKDVPWDTALESIIKAQGFVIVREKGQTRVSQK